MTDAPNQPLRSEARYDPFPSALRPPPRPESTWSFASGHARASVTIALLVVATAAEIACVLQNKLDFSAGRRGVAFDPTGDLIDWLAGAIVFASIIAFAAWTHRVYRNLPALGVRDLRFTPAWVVAWLFIPLANLVLPYFAFIEIWRGSDPVPKTDAEGRRKRRIPLLIIGWWIVNLLPYVVLLLAVGLFGYWYYEAWEAAGVSTNAAETATAFAQLDRGLAYLNGVVLPLLTAAAAIFGIFIVRRIDVNQQKKFDSLRTG